MIGPTMTDEPDTVTILIDGPDFTYQREFRKTPWVGELVEVPPGCVRISKVVHRPDRERVPHTRPMIALEVQPANDAAETDD